MIKRKAIEIYCGMLLGTRAFPQISHVRPDMRQRALYRGKSASVKISATGAHQYRRKVYCVMCELNFTSLRHDAVPR